MSGKGKNNAKKPGTKAKKSGSDAKTISAHSTDMKELQRTEKLKVRTRRLKARSERQISRLSQKNIRLQKRLEQRNKYTVTYGMIAVGLWLLGVTAFIGFGLVQIFSDPGSNSGSAGSELSTRLFQRDVVIVMITAGLGATITTAMGYLEHACSKNDFEDLYVSWYIARPFIGALTGLAFYFVLRSGMLALNIDIVSSENQGEDSLNKWALSAVSTLVGLFSKNAVEKLREVFDTVFTTRAKDYAELFKRLPPEMVKDIIAYLNENERNNVRKRLKIRDSKP